MTDKTEKPFVKTADGLGWRISQYIQEFDAGERSHKDLDVISNLVGKMINNRKAQLEYQHLKKTYKDMPDMKWFEPEDE